MKKWFKHPLAYVAMLISVITGVLFIVSAVPGFNKLPHSTDQLRMTIVDQDKTTVTKKMTTGLKDNVPFKHVTTTTNLSAAKTRLSNRTDAMTVAIPAGFTKSVETGKQPKLNFYVSDSNGLLQNNISRSAISAIQDKIAAQLTSGRITGAMAEQIGPQIAKKASAQAQAKAAKAGGQMPPAMMKKMQQQVKQTVTKQTQIQAQRAAKKLTAAPVSHTTHLNKLGDNYQYQMAPMFLNLGLYLGFMIMGIILTLMFMGGRFAMGKWTAFLAAQINGVLGTVIGPLITILTLRCFIQFSGSSFLTLWGSEWLFGLGAFELSFALALLMFGLPSIIVQLPLMVSQVIAGGAIIPRKAMGGFYQWLSYHAPMYQGVYLSFNALYGGGQTGAFDTALWLVAGLGLLATILIVAISYRSRQPKGFAKWVSFD
ncbi:ABC transporter permease [Secundilactobacillus hailunensis]|uniref:ABC transporter permease n=1 Tax=Secundilactobacillus hailunensis TaxID=2559923 RepID=A0ABW1T9I4_9LACO|nr:ABC transporter permease [Secundilactobacillus hailunensis]